MEIVEWVRCTLLIMLKKKLIDVTKIKKLIT